MKKSKNIYASGSPRKGRAFEVRTCLKCSKISYSTPCSYCGGGVFKFIKGSEYGKNMTKQPTRSERSRTKTEWWEDYYNQLFGKSLWQEHKSENPYKGEVPQYHEASKEIKSFIRKVVAEEYKKGVFLLEPLIRSLVVEEPVTTFPEKKKVLSISWKRYLELLETIDKLKKD